ncbi:MAG: VWA domain-containing protein [Hyphomicrobiales bacterium]
MSNHVNRVPPPQGEDVASFLAKVKSTAVAPANGQGRLVFAMDATMSRQPTWDRALSIQGQMFSETKRAGKLQVQLVYFRGLHECKASRWVDDPDALARLMTGVDCRGGNTQVARILAHVKAEAAKTKPSAVVFVGDAFEENIDAVCQSAGEVGLLGVPMFMFQENDARAETAFGKSPNYARCLFPAGQPSRLFWPHSLGGGCLCHRGSQALASRAAKDDASRHLLQQLK